MITFTLNNEPRTYDGDEARSLMSYLREVEGLTSVKNGCDGQAACGACMVEMNGRPTLSCVTPMRKVNGASIFTLEGFPPQVKETLARAFVKKGAVQCGFCTPGILTCTKILLQENPNPTETDIRKALRLNFCRCTGYQKIVEAIQLGSEALRKKEPIELETSGRVGTRHPKYEAYQRALGQAPFVDDLRFEGMVYGALKFSDYPRARVLKIDTSVAEQIRGVLRIFTAKDIPGNRMVGLIVNDWPLMIAEGEVTHYVGDVLAGVVAETDAIARKAAAAIRVDYEVLEPLTDMLKAEASSVRVHEGGNLLETTVIRRGGRADEAIRASDFIVTGTYETQRIEHAYLETEAAVARPWKRDGIEVFSEGQGVYEDRRQIARILGLPEEKINVNLVPNGGGFGGKEDLTVQGHAALFAAYLKKPVKVRLTRDESMRMHPKRHPIHMEYTVGANRDGKLTVVKARMIGDTGAYASVGMKVLERAAGHAAGAYHVPVVDVIAKTVYTNNIPCGAMRGFGDNQATFALESAIDELCEKAGFDRWQFRYDNALVKGSMTTTGQVLEGGVGVRETLLAVREKFYQARYAGLACAIKNTGIGNGAPDFSEVKIEIQSENHVVLHHGWTEMGQGVNTVAVQMFCEATGIDPNWVEVKVSTQYEARSGMTTASRATSLVGNAILDAVKGLKQDLKNHSLNELVGRVYSGQWVCDWTTAPGDPGEVKTHYSYSYATQLVVLNERGEIDTIYAAHDAGRIINPTLFEGQIEGAVHMGLGYALSEDFPMEGGFPVTTRLNRLGILKAADMPRVVVIGVEVADPVGPYGAKGVGEIGLVATAPAVANAFYQFDGVRRRTLPMMRKTLKSEKRKSK
ncbi:MAG: selenium-dependent xanthine dehydrogenase [Calditrichaeota bacterium]|nr:selenium-dependent xanthine dehydrogenase [Calditrichota bacterium]